MIIYLEAVLLFGFFCGRSALFRVTEDEFQGLMYETYGMEGEAYFLSDIGLCQYYDGRLLLFTG